MTAFTALLLQKRTRWQQYVLSINGSPVVPMDLYYKLQLAFSASCWIASLLLFRKL